MKLYVHKYPSAQTMAECREVPDDAAAPGAPLELMTLAEFAAWKAEAAQVQWLANLNAARAAAIAAADAAYETERGYIQAALQSSQDMIDGVGTTADRQRRVKLALGRLIQFLIKRRGLL